MSNINFTPTAYTVKDPGNGKERRYEAGTHPRMVADAQRVFIQFAAAYPSLSALVVPDHFVQLFCKAQDNASWSGGYGVSYETQQGIFLSLAEKGLGQARFN
jgi:hypothetical protein